MKLLAEVLKPIPLVVWGGPALEHCGTKAFIRGYVFILEESDRDLVAAKLLDAGFASANWSYGSCAPTELQKLDDDPQRRHEEWIPEYEDIDEHSIRFAFPPRGDRISNEPVALILPSFAGLGPPHSRSREQSQGEGQQDAGTPQGEASLREAETPQEGSRELSQEETQQKAGPIQQSGTSQEEALLREGEAPQAATTSTESEPLPTSEIGRDTNELQLGERSYDAETPQQNDIEPGEGLLRGGETPEETTSPAAAQPVPSSELRLELDDQQPENGPHDEKRTQDLQYPPAMEQPDNEVTTEDPRFTCVDGFLYYPRLPVSLESLIRARLRTPENEFGLWVSMLEVWAIPYLWAQTMVPEDVLDGIEDEKIKAWFNKATKRFEGGIDRLTITKRKGRVRNTRPIVNIDL